MPRDLRTRIFHLWFRLRRPLTLGVRGVVTNDAGEVLLLRHSYVAGWHFPGGGVEKAETGLEALARELEEEAGVIPTTAPTLLGVYANHANHPNDHVLVYRVRDWSPTRATSRGEIVETGFFDPHSPPAGVTGGTARRLAEIFGDAPLSEIW